MLFFVATMTNNNINKNMERILRKMNRRLFLYLLLVSPFAAWGQNTGDFTVTGTGDYSFADGVLRVTSGEVRVQTNPSDTTEHAIVLEGGKLVLAGLNIRTGQRPPIEVTGTDVVIELAEGTKNTLVSTYRHYAGIRVPEGKKVTFTGAGELEVKVDTKEENASCGIGGQNPASYYAYSDFSCGTIVFDLDGTIRATGGHRAAGIGTCMEGGTPVSGTLHIKKGRIEAEGGRYAAGIGAGPDGGSESGKMLNVIIEGGNVTARAGQAASDVGSGLNCKVTVSITQIGGTVHGTLKPGGSGSYLIVGPDATVGGLDDVWCSNKLKFADGKGTVQGRVVIPAGITLTIDAGETLTIPEGASLVIDGTLVVDGTLVIDGTLICNGTLVRKGASSGEENIAYALAYDLNGGTGQSPATENRAEGETVTLPDFSSFTKEGYTCLGWAESPNATEALPSLYAMPDKAVTLYAVWVKDAEDVSKEVKGAVGEAFAEMDLTAFIDEEIGECTITWKEGNALPEGFSLSDDYRLSGGNPLLQAMSGYEVQYLIHPMSGAKDAILTLVFNIVKGETSIVWNDEIGPFTYDGEAVEIAAPQVTGVAGFTDTAVLMYAKTGEGEGNDTVLSEAPVDAGSYKVTASFAGNANYNPATPVVKAFTIAKADAVISWEDEIGPFTYDGEAVEIAAPQVTSVAGFTDTAVLTYAKPGEGEGDDTVLSEAPVDAGSYKVTASFAGNANHNPATPVVKSFIIAKADAVISWEDEIGPFTYDGEAVEIAAPQVTGVAGFTDTAVLAYAKTGEGDDTVLSEAPVDAGSYKVTASFAGNDNHNPATPVVKAFTIERATLQAEDYTVPTGLTAAYGQTLAEVALPEAENGTWSWQDETTPVGDAGEKTFKATFKPANENYNPVKDIEVAIIVSPAEFPEGSGIRLDKASDTIVFAGTDTTFVLTAIVSGDLGADPQWVWESSDEWVATVRADTDTVSSIYDESASEAGIRQSVATITVHSVGNAIITIAYTDSHYTGTVAFALTVAEPLNPSSIEQGGDAGVKVYTVSDAIRVYTPDRERVSIFSLSGAVLRMEEQVGIRDYTGLPHGVYIVRVGSRSWKLWL